MRRFCLPLAIASLSIGASARAQTIRGRVVSRSGESGVPGSIVLLLDSAQTTTVARTLTNERGEYFLRAPLLGRYTLRAMRIGFRPTTTAPFALAGDTSIVLRITDIPVMLQAVATREKQQCRIRPDSGLLTFQLWEQARTALLATAITQDDAAYRLSAEQHSRLYAVRNETLRDVRFADSTRGGAVTWRSRPPEALRADGYVTRDSTGIDFVAPDIDVLLSPYFADTHCLRVNDRAPNGSGLIGLDFDPVGRQKHVEIRGTLWLDRQSRELRSLAFRYDNFAFRGVDSLAGGEARFARLATGAWVMTDWVTRMPIPARTPRGGMSELPLVASAGRWTSDRVRVTGGDLRAVLHGPDTLWTRPTGTLRVTLLGATGARDVPVERAMVQLVGSERSALTDDTGIVTFDALVAGTYLLEATTEELQLLGRAPTVARAIVTTNSVVDAQLHVERTIDAVRAICGAFPARPGMIVGVVTRDGTPVPDVPLVVNEPVKAGAGDDWLDATNKLKSDANGRFRLCKVGVNEATVIRTADDSARVTVVLTPDRFVRGVTLELPSNVPRATPPNR